MSTFEKIKTAILENGLPMTYEEIARAIDLPKYVVYNNIKRMLTNSLLLIEKI